MLNEHGYGCGPLKADEGNVWQAVDVPGWGGVQTWEQVPEGKATTPIPCAVCGKPAWLLDNFWPYHNEASRCRACYERERRERW